MDLAIKWLAGQRKEFTIHLSELELKEMTLLDLHTKIVSQASAFFESDLTDLDALALRDQIKVIQAGHYLRPSEFEEGGTLSHFLFRLSPESRVLHVMVPKELRNPFLPSSSSSATVSPELRSGLDVNSSTLPVDLPSIEEMRETIQEVMPNFNFESPFGRLCGQIFSTPDFGQFLQNVARHPSLQTLEQQGFNRQEAVSQILDTMGLGDLTSVFSNLPMTRFLGNDPDGGENQTPINRMERIQKSIRILNRLGHTNQVSNLQTLMECQLDLLDTIETLESTNSHSPSPPEVD